MKNEIDILINVNEEELKEVIVFGGGYWGIMTIYFLHNMGIEIVECFDNDVSKHERLMFEKYKCTYPRFIKPIPIIIAVYNEDVAESIKRQCIELGYRNFIYIDFDKMKIAYNALPDKEFCELKYALVFDGRTIDWENPRNFNEKLQWMKLYNRNPQYTMLADKYEVKRYVEQVLGSEYIIPTLGVWESADDIEWDALPEQFVLKCTHDSGSVIVCKDKAHFDYTAAKETLNGALKIDFSQVSREWVYKDIKPRIIAEKYIVDKVDNELRDYKFYCFDGHVAALLLATNRQSKTEPLCFDYFDEEFKHLNWTNHWHPNATEMPHKPIHFEKMKEIAMRLSKGFPHVRVDLYEVDGNIYFGEFTFFDQGGFLRIHPEDWEVYFGDMFKLPEMVD